MFSRQRKNSVIEREACEWLAAMNSDSQTTAEIGQFQAWLNADPAHRLTFERIQDLWADLAELRDYAPAAETLPGRVQRRVQPAWSRWLREPDMLWSAAGLVAVLVLTLLFVYTILPAGPTSPNREVATQTAEIRRVSLPDGSTITVGAQSAIEIRYSPSERRVEMMAGEAFFSVSKDPARPFIVSATGAEIRVTGTQFDVHRSHEALSVAVVRGRVEVRPDHGRSGRTGRVLTANQRIRIIPDRALPEPQRIRHGQPGAWRQGRLVYEDARLSDVIADADRYYPGNIIMDTEDLGDLMVSAAFRADQIDKMMQTLAAALPITVKNLANGDLLLRRKTPGG